MKNSQLTLILLFCVVFFACEKEIENEPTLSFDEVSGFVQKGPYINGTDITIFEMKRDLKPTGKSFTSQIHDNRGMFVIPNVELTSQFIELKANGFYFNEVSNSNSVAQLTLFALSDLTNRSSLNINILTSLEKNRVQYLVSSGKSFSEAKNQAQSEILAMFGINKDNLSKSEQLNITQPGEDNAILLAISVILQGHLSVAELSELIANISSDIREDGVLNSQSLGSILINNAKTINLEEIRLNLENRYAELGLQVVIPDFEKYVNHFIENTDYAVTNNISYPLIQGSRLNVISDSTFIAEPGLYKYSIAAFIPKGRSIRICCQPSEDFDWLGFSYLNVVGAEVESSHYPDSVIIHAVGQSEVMYCSVVFGSMDPLPPTSIDFIIYEDGATLPTRIKTVSSF